MDNRKLHQIDIEQLFSIQTVLLIVAGIALNVFGSKLALTLKLPLYLDNVGSILTAVLGGAVPGMTAAFTANYLGSFGEPAAIMFGVLTVTMACLATRMSRHGLLRSFKGFVILWAFMVMIGGAAGSVMGWFLYGETVGGTIAAPYVFWLCGHGINGFLAQFLGDVFLDMIDKALTLLLVAAALRLLPARLRSRLPLGYIYGCSKEELAAEDEKRAVPYTGRSVFSKIIRITTIALTILAVVVTCYSTASYYTDTYLADHDTYALFRHIVRLLGLEFVVIIFAMIIAARIVYDRIIKPLDAIVDQTVAFRNSTHEQWLTSDAWNHRYVVNTQDELQILYETICRSEELISRKFIRVRENENKLTRLSQTDLMTGVMNRGSGERRITHLIQRGVPGCFCLLDCDHFKHINDTYGHLTGDSVLILIAKKLQRACNDKDVVFRLGGDEFGLYLRNIQSRPQADAFFASLFGSIDAISIPGLKGSKVSVSFGAAFYPGGTAMQFDDLYKRADAALYESKKIDGSAVTFSEK